MPRKHKGAAPSPTRETIVVRTRPRPEVDREAEQARVDEMIARGVGKTATTGDKLKAELDDLLDEIDEVLEDNAEEFVRSYVQKGGQCPWHLCGYIVAHPSFR